MLLNRINLLMVFVGGAVFGIALNLAFNLVYEKFKPAEYERSRTSFSKFTNPYLECPGFSGSDNQLTKAKSEILDYIDAQSVNDDSLEVSVYARDLNNGPWIGINEKERYVSASLMKVPVMMMLLKRVELGLISLEDTLVYDPEKLDPQRIINNDSLEFEAILVPGESYTVSQLIDFMIIYSSNEALHLLVQSVNLDDAYIFENMVGVNALEPGYPLEVSVKNYSAFFRVLYNASFLNRENSEWALETLAAARFDFGLKAGVPENILTANKYGNQEMYRDEDKIIESRNELRLARKTRFLHDCGIVYHPKSPYALCVMTRSGEKSNIALSEIIANISAIVYKANNASR